ncbi:unnamed protein product [Pleuronectes platessa]|uniref:Uncharacterized protein n=1 Tax=Pleuronectes platessa TaxID=8262 RepID=A0A9N7Y9J3_PLEPL|nr:unnamed protein product [Pleuronectes platessa]
MRGSRRRGPIKIKLDSSWKEDGRTERDEVSVEVNVPQRGYNDPCELGVGLRGVEMLRPNESQSESCCGEMDGADCPLFTAVHNVSVPSEETQHTLCRLCLSHLSSEARLSDGREVEAGPVERQRVPELAHKRRSIWADLALEKLKYVAEGEERSSSNQRMRQKRIKNRKVLYKYHHHWRALPTGSNW